MCICVCLDNDENLFHDYLCVFHVYLCVFRHVYLGVDENVFHVYLCVFRHDFHICVCFP